MFPFALSCAIIITIVEAQEVTLKFSKVPGHYMTSSYGISSVMARSVVDCGRRCGDEITCLGWSLISNISPGVTCELRTHVTGDVSRDLVPNAEYQHYSEYIQN